LGSRPGKLEEKEKGIKHMKITILKALMLPIALLALGGINQASAATCAASYTMTAVTATGFSCTVGDLTFSNFDYKYDAGIDTGCTSDCTAPSTPNPTVITDYSSGNTVNEFQNETGVVQYLVTGCCGTTISEVDGAISGSAVNTASGDLDKDICANNQFGGGSSPNGSCPNFLANETVVASDLALTTSGTQSDGTPDWAGPFSLSTVGVYDGWSLDGGTTMTTASANLTSVENDFVDASGTVPEPGTIVLLGSALVGLGLIRRRRKVA